MPGYFEEIRRSHESLQHSAIRSDPPGVLEDIGITALAKHEPGTPPAGSCAIHTILRFGGQEKSDVSTEHQAAAWMCLAITAARLDSRHCVGVYQTPC
jgi:hypothetical protein